MNLAPYVQRGGRRTTHPSHHHTGMRSPCEWDGVGTEGAIIGTSHPIRDHQKGSFWEEGPSLAFDLNIFLNMLRGRIRNIAVLEVGIIAASPRPIHLCL